MDLFIKNNRVSILVQQIRNQFQILVHYINFQLNRMTTEYLQQISPDKSRPRNHFKELIKIIPQKFIVFQCEDDEPMGEIRITVTTTPSYPAILPELQFELMCTNKQNYKVSNSKGKLNKDSTSHLIRIYIKNIDNLEKCLSDKFRVRIFDPQNPDKIVLTTKLKVLIEKHKQALKIDEMNNNITQTISRTASLYTSPSIYVNPSALGTTTSIADAKSIIYFSRVLANEQKKISPLQQREQTLNDFKLSYDESNQKFFNKEKQLKTAENNFQKNKAKQKVCFGLLIALFLLSILFGFLVKKIIKSDMWYGMYESMKSQYFN